MKELLKHIPGFRSNVKWKKILATIYYFFTFLMLFEEFHLFIFLLAIPGIIFSIGNLKKAKKDNKPIKAMVMTLIISIGALIGSTAYIEPTQEAMKELEQPTNIEAVEGNKEDNQEANIEVAKQEEIENIEAVAQEEKQEEEESQEAVDKEDPEEATQKEPLEEIHKLAVHYLDVGQGESIFIQLPNGQTLLIDGGTKSNGGIVLGYLKNLKVNKIDYLVATHPHEDHIGGLIGVINQHDIGQIYMPKVSHTTKAFEDLLLAIKNKGNKIKSAKAGTIIFDTEELNIEIIAPEESNSDNNLNNHSAVIRLQYKNNSFLFTGDAEKESESKMVSSRYDLKSDVLKVGHHGSNTSTTDSFLNKVEPKYAVISCGAGNTYGHPNDEVMSKLGTKDVTIFRTDLDGTIVATSDGERITFEKKGSSIKNAASASIGSSTQSGEGNTGESSVVKAPETDYVEEVYITNTGAKYHRGGCSSLKKSKIAISLEKAKGSYGPCKRCNP